MTESSENEYSIVDAEASHGEAMLALMPRLAAFDIPDTRVAEHLWMHDEAMLRKWLAGEADDVLVHVVEDDSEGILGFAMASLRPELLSTEPSAHLEAIAVAEGTEGRGIGKMLLAAIEDDARSRGALTMTLHVFATEVRARGFYEGILGLEPGGIEEHAAIALPARITGPILRENSTAGPRFFVGLENGRVYRIGRK